MGSRDSAFWNSKGPSSVVMATAFGGGKRKKAQQQKLLIEAATTKLDMDAAKSFVPAAPVRSNADAKLRKTVQKAITDNFKGMQWTASTLYATIVEGKTLPEHIEERIRAKMPRGKAFYSVLKEKFAETDASNKFKIKNMDESIPEDVEKALVRIATDSKDVCGMKEFLLYGAALPNQRTAAIVCKQMSLLPPFHPPRNQDLWQHFFKYIARTGFSVQFKEEWGQVRHTCDQLLSKSFLGFRSENLSPKL